MSSIGSVIGDLYVVIKAIPAVIRIIIAVTIWNITYVLSSGI